MAEYRHLADAGLGSVSAVVTSLPAGYTLGEARFDSGIKYRLIYNDGGEQISQGFACKPKGSVGPYSMTVTTTSKTFANIGAGVAHNATITTASYGWIAVQGRISVVGDASSVPTGSAFYVGSDGKVELMPQSVVTGNVVVGVNIGGAASKTVTTGARSGDCIVSFPEV